MLNLLSKISVDVSCPKKLHTCVCIVRSNQKDKDLPCILILIYGSSEMNPLQGFCLGHNARRRGGKRELEEVFGKMGNLRRKT